jgi:hypothetical protein
MEKQVHLGLICMVNFLVLRKSRQNFPPVATVLELFNDLQNKVLLCDSRANFPHSRMRPNTYWFNDLVVFNKLPPSILIVISQS